ncbi:pyrophosphatase PpaX [Paenibacillus polygoni]|uniref:Pyrophosphatase PpaX n=1 Tax=Paenibacillus polygoni TaxID=3050112 RepID=A0ABY8X4H4_9BACL|nr:pyrophosphatase PpaX [Paenibacillus polygoni]WIV19362.1 pyrophosphatase PpaX [Paenibacillus polygoni]
MIKTVLFDLDGTIIDTNELIISSFIHVLNELGPGALSREEIIPHMGGTLEQQMQAFTGKPDVAEYVTGYRAYNSVHHDDMVKPFPGVMDVVKKLHEQGIRMGVVTTKIRPSTLRVLEQFDLLKYMESIVTVSDVTHPKPHPEPVLTAVKQLQVDPSETLMVGDSPVDIQSAKAAGVKAAGVAWSLKGEAKLREYDPDYILHDMHDILTLTKKE